MFLKYILLSILLSVYFNAESSSVDIFDLNVDPKPNYKKTKSVEMSKLTNSKTSFYPIWKSTDFLGWMYKKPLAISFTVTDDVVGKYVQLSFHTSKNNEANAFIPYMVNVFTSNDKHLYTLSGSKIFIDSVFKNKSNHWLTNKFYVEGNDVTVVIHPKGPFLFLDEISITLLTDVFSDDEKFVGKAYAINKKSLLNRSNILLKKHFHNKNITSNLNNDTDADDFKVWKRHPWGVDTMDDQSEMKFNRMDVIGGDYETELYSIAIFNRGEESVLYDMFFSGIDKTSYQTFVGKDILTSDGRLVNDALLSYNNEKIMIEGGATKIVYFKFDFTKLAVGQHKLNVVVENSEAKKKESIEILLEIVETNLGKDEFRPYVNPWSYTHNKPIWNNNAHYELINSGVNVWVVPPQNLPSVGGLNKKNIPLINALRLKLSKLLTLYERPKILFFLGWSDDNHPFDEHAFNLKDSKSFSLWLSAFEELMASLSVPYTDWALYPVDEPKASSFSLLLATSSVVKKHNDKIQIYANPIKENHNSLSLAALYKLREMVDIWQPITGFVTNENQSFFKQYGENFWVYYNPKSPPKSASPITDYRLTSWKAWRVGAKGVGFWSFDDTRGSSAWDDFDGTRPDWAVVYEGENGIISSLRWEAFKQGIEDYQLLELSKYKIEHGGVSGFDFLDIQKVRKEILFNLKNN